MAKGILLAFSILCALSQSFAAAPDCTTTPQYQPVANTDAGDGKSYYICLSKAGTGTLVECPDDLVFNPATKGCGTKATPPPSVCSSATQTFVVADPTCLKYEKCEAAGNGVLAPAEKACTASELFDPFLRKCVTSGFTCGSTKPDCENPAYEGMFLPVAGDCHSYYKCLDGIRVKGSCPSGTSLDVTTQMCISDKKSTCGGGSGNLGDICKGKASKFVADPNYCIGYYYCIDEQTPYWDFCEGEGKYFNNGYCTSTKPSTCKCEGIELPATGKVYVALADKTMYMICEAGQAPVEKTCPTGYTFDATEESCV